MIEATLAKQLLDQALTQAAAYGAGKIKLIQGRVCEKGELSSEKLRAHFLEYAKGTAAQGSKLELKTQCAKARCLSCDRIGAAHQFFRICSFCGDERLEFLDPLTVSLTRMEVG